MSNSFVHASHPASDVISCVRMTGTHGYVCNGTRNGRYACNCTVNRPSALTWPINTSTRTPTPSILHYLIAPSGLCFGSERLACLLRRQKLIIRPGSNDKYAFGKHIFCVHGILPDCPQNRVYDTQKPGINYLFEGQKRIFGGSNL